MNKELAERAEAEAGILLAIAFASGAHAAVKQVRKYTDDPYIIHPLEVANLVAAVPGSSDEMIIAALLHDVVEDTGVTVGLIDTLFGPTVASYVFSLTDHFTPENFPDLNRKARKENEAFRYSVLPNEVKTIKLADGLSNTVSIAEHDRKFMKVYGPEKRSLLANLTGGDKGLYRALDLALLEAGY